MLQNTAKPAAGKMEVGEEELNNNAWNVAVVTEHQSSFAANKMDK